MDADSASKEKARKELHKNATSYTEQILEATSHETSFTATYLPFLEPSKRDEQDMPNNAGEERTNSLATFSNELLHKDMQMLDSQLELT